MEDKLYMAQLDYVKIYIGFEQKMANAQHMVLPNICHLMTLKNCTL